MFWNISVLGYNNIEMNEKNKKILTFLFSFVIIGLLGAALALAFVLGYNPSRPNKVEIIDDGNNIYMFADVNDNYRAYRFKFTNAEKGDLVIDSTKNLMTNYDMFRSGVEIGVEYEISVCYVSEDNVQNTQYSEPIKWKTYAYLESPVIYETGDNLIRWQNIENADYYEVHYNYQADEKIVVTDENFIDLQRIDGGQRDIYVVAKSNSESYKRSLKSNIIELTVVHEIQNFSTISLNSEGENKILNLTSAEKIEKIIVYINNQQHKVNVTSTLQYNIYTYSVDITSIYVDGATIGVSPTTINEYNVYTSGQVLYLE